MKAVVYEIDYDTEWENQDFLPSFVEFNVDSPTQYTDEELDEMAQETIFEETGLTASGFMIKFQ